MRYADSHCSYTETNEPHNYMFTGACVYCSQAISVVIAGTELYNYRQGKPIKDAMPSVNSDEREFLMSGICPACWEKMFSTDEMLFKNTCNCGEQGEDLHSCPYQSDVNSDPTSMCNCCDKCTQQCTDDI